MSLSRSPILVIKLTLNRFTHKTHVKIKKIQNTNHNHWPESTSVDNSEVGSELASAQVGERERERGGGSERGLKDDDDMR